MAKLEDAKRRSAVIAERIRQRTDLRLRELVRDFECDLSFEPIADYAISDGSVEPRQRHLDSIPSWSSLIRRCCGGCQERRNTTVASHCCPGSESRR